MKLKHHSGANEIFANMINRRFFLLKGSHLVAILTCNYKQRVPPFVSRVNWNSQIQKALNFVTSTPTSITKSRKKYKNQETYDSDVRFVIETNSCNEKMTAVMKQS